MKRVSSLVISGALLLAIVAAPGLTRAAAKGGSQKPRIAVLEFKNKADNQWWYHGGATAAQDVFVTELVKSGKFRVVEREQLEALMKEKGLALSGDVDPSTAVRIGKLLGVNYLLTGAVTEYGNTHVEGGGGGVFAGKKKFVAALNARIIDTSTGESACRGIEPVVDAAAGVGTGIKAVAHAAREEGSDGRKFNFADLI